jgi:hypothetical protein
MVARGSARLLGKLLAATDQDNQKQLSWSRACSLIERVSSQMTKTDRFAFGGGWDHITDLNLFICHHHTMNE